MVEDSMVEENLRIEYGPFDNLTKYDVRGNTESRL